MTKSLLKKRSRDISTTRDAQTPFEEMDRIFDAFTRGWMQPFAFSRPAFSGMGNVDMAFPRFDVIDRDQEIVVRAELPAVHKDDLDITLTENLLTISGRTLSEDNEEDGEFYRSEIRRGEFSRSVTLPNDVDADNVRSTFKDGMLTLILPKVEVARRRRIEIS